MPIQLPLATTVSEDVENMPTQSTLGDVSPVEVTLQGTKERSGGEVDSLLGAVLAFGQGLGLPITMLADKLVLNRVLDAAKAAGVVPEDVNADMFTRFSFPGAFERMEPLINESIPLSYGAGDYVPYNEGLGRTIEQTGMGTTLSLPMIFGAGAPGALLAGGTTALTPQAITQGSRLAGSMLREGMGKSVMRGLMTEQAAAYAANPTRYAATELGLGGLSGAITQGAEEMIPGSGVYAGLTPAAIIMGGKGLGLLGQKYMNYSPAGRLISWASEDPNVGGVMANVKDAVTGTPAQRQARAENKVQRRIIAESETPSGISETERLAQVQKRIAEVVGDELELSPAEVTMSPSLGVEQSRIEARMTGETLQRNNQRKMDNLARLEAFKEGLFGSNSGPSAIMDEATGRIDRVVTQTKKATADAASTVDSVSDSATGILPAMEPGGTRAAGYSFRQQLASMRDSAEKQADRMAAKFKINTADPVGDATAAQQNVLSAMNIDETSISYKNLPQVIRDFVEFDFAAKNRGGKISFQDWKTFRRQVGSAYASATGPDKAALAVLRKELDNIAFGKAKTADNYRKFAQWYDTNVILPFEDTVIRKVMRYGPGTRAEQGKFEYLMPEEYVAKEFLKDSKSAQAFMRTFGNDPAYTDTMRAVIFDEARKAAVRDGVIDPKKLQQYIAKNKEALAELKLQDPATGETVAMDVFLGDTANTMGAILARQASLRAREATVQRYALTKALSKVEGVGDNLELEQVIDMGIKNPKLMKQLGNAIRRSGDPDLEIALKREIAQRILTPKMMDNPETFGNFLAQNERMLRNAFGDQHYEDIAVLNEGMRRVLATGGVSGGAGLTKDNLVDMFSQATGITPQGYSARVINILEGRVSPRTSFVWMASQAARAKSLRSIDQAFERAIFDKDFAKSLTEATVNAAEVSVPQSQRLAAKFFFYGIPNPAEPEIYETKVTLPRSLPSATTTAPQPPVVAPPAPAPEPPPFKMPTVPRLEPLPFTPPVVPAPSGQQGAVPSTQQYGTLFPNDSLGQAIANRGIMSLQG